MDSPPLSVLVIDDDPADADLIVELLRRHLPGPSAARQAHALGEALTLLRAASFDIVLLDLKLPDSQGLETFTVLKGHTDLPVVVDSGDGDEALAAQTVRLGAEDYIVKHQMRGDALSRAVRFALERAGHRATERELGRVNDQLRVAEEVQKRLRPAHTDALPGLDVATEMRPAEFASGDYCDVIPLPDGTVGLVVADVSGHGLGSWHLMLETRASLRALAGFGPDIRHVLPRLNRLLYPDCEATGHFVTIFLAQIDPQARTVDYVAAGHQGDLMYEAGGDVALEASGPPLGVLPEFDQPPPGRVAMSAGDILLIPTDGLAEAADCDGRHFGRRRIRECVRAERKHPARHILDELYQQARAFAGPAPQLDDMTAVLVKAL